MSASLEVVHDAIEEGLLTLPILYLSRYIIDHKSQYYELLLDVTRNHHWDNWILYMLAAVEKTSIWTRAKIDAICRLFEHTTDYARQNAGRVYSYELISLIFSQPYCRIQDVVGADIAGRQAASRNLKKLVEIGILSEQSVGRDKLFIHEKLLKLLTKNPNEFQLYE